MSNDLNDHGWNLPLHLMSVAWLNVELLFLSCVLYGADDSSAGSIPISSHQKPNRQWTNNRSTKRVYLRASYDYIWSQRLITCITLQVKLSLKNWDSNCSTVDNPSRQPVVGRITLYSFESPSCASTRFSGCLNEAGHQTASLFQPETRPIT